MINQRKLQLFVLTAKHGNLSQAAEELHLSQSAASTALAQFENHIGQRLFHRDGKRLILNNHGQQLLPKAITLVEKLQQLKSSTQEPNQLRGKLSIAASTTVANYILPAKLNTFVAKHPQTDIHLTVSNTQTALDRLLNFEVDIAIVEGMQAHPKLEYQPCIKDELKIFCSPKNPLATKSERNLQELMDAPWILRENASGTRQILEAALQHKGLSPNTQCIVESSFAIKQMVLNSKSFISCLSKFIIDKDKYVDITPATLELQRYFYLAYNKAREQSEIATEFILLLG